MKLSDKRLLVLAFQSSTLFRTSFSVSTTSSWYLCFAGSISKRGQGPPRRPLTSPAVTNRSLSESRPTTVDTTNPKFLTGHQRSPPPCAPKSQIDAAKMPVCICKERTDDIYWVANDALHWS